MGSRILIVEDHFIEANDLRIILERAGYEVCGIANSVLRALTFLEEEKPDIVLVDIFLKGNLTGIDLAKRLTKANVPFIFLSANSNQSTLEEAKATQPYCFLVKPYREPDILVALEIAMYRHQHQIDLMSRHATWLSDLLIGILSQTESKGQKLLLLAKAFQQFIHFDHIMINLSTIDSGTSVFGFKRINYSDYSALPGLEILKAEYLAERVQNCFFKTRDITILDESSFKNNCLKNKIHYAFNTIYGSLSCIWLPVFYKDVPDMSISFFSSQPNNFTGENVELLKFIQPLLGNVLEHIRQCDLVAGMAEETYIGPSEDEVIHAKFPGIIGKSPNLLHVMDQVNQVAPFDTTILLLGETGTGKEGLVDAIHRLSDRSTKPLIKIHCAAIPQGLIESELFGHEKGAFTGATERRIGRFEQAQGGTIFLDEIGEIPLDVQSKLLRVLQEKEIERVGGRGTIKINVRIVAATNRNLHKEVAAGNFRIDLFYRINVFPINVPPLRERKEDIPLLIDHFLNINSSLYDGKTKSLSEACLQKMVSYNWPGNIRELQHMVERLVLINKGAVIHDFEIQETEPITESPAKPEFSEGFETIQEMEKKHILKVINSCNGKINGKGGAAEILNIPPTTLNLKMKKLGIGWKHIFK
jgi:DNA-binding NtrC family response regulator